MRIAASVYPVLIVAVLASGCSSSGEKEQLSYRDSEITPTLEIPPDLTQLSAEQNVDLPGSKVGLPANSGRYVETGNLNIEVRTLPTVEGIRIDGQGDLHWMEVPEKAEVLYPQIRTFWAEQGFRLIKDEPAVGVMETEWLSQVSGSDSFFGSILESMKNAEFKDQYKTRLERSADNEATHIFIAHRGQEQLVPDTEKQQIASLEAKGGWHFTKPDPAREYEMLSRMMLYLGMRDEQVRAEMEKIGLFAARASIEYDEEDEETFLVLDHGYRQSWNRLLLQLDRMSIPVLERDDGEDSGSVEIALASIAARELDEDERESTILLSLEGSAGSKTRVDVRNDNGTLVQSELSRKILQTLQRQLK
jgi:outer membrane protein assembly factor BamC